jgi:hypothetical protein
MKYEDFKTLKEGDFVKIIGNITTPSVQKMNDLIGKNVQIDYLQNDSAHDGCRSLVSLTKEFGSWSFFIADIDFVNSSEPTLNLLL